MNDPLEKHSSPASDVGLPAALLARLADALDTSFDPVAARRGESENPSIEGDWSDQLAAAGRAHQFTARVTWLSPDQAIGAARAGVPLVTYTGGGRGEWVALLDRRGRRARLARAGHDDVWVDARSLQDLLRPGDGEEPACWAVVEPFLPFRRTAHPAEDGHGTLSPFRRLLAMLHPDRGDLWTVVVFAVLIGALSLATPLTVQQLVNTVAFGGLLQPVAVLTLLLLASLAFAAALSALQAYIVEIVQRRLFVRVVGDLASRLPRVEGSAFDRQHGPELVNRFFDIVTVQKVGATLLLDGVTVVLQTLVGLVILSFYHPLMLAFSLLLMASIAIVILVFGRGAVRTAIEESRAKYAIAGWMEELARHRAAFRDGGGQAYAFERADRLACDYIEARRRHFRIVLRQLVGALGLHVVASSVLLALGGGLVIAGQLTLGQLVASELIVTVIVAAFAKLGKHMEAFYDLLAAVDKLGHLFDLPLERDGRESLPFLSTPAAVEGRGLAFSFEKTPVFAAVDFALEPGERVALQGPAGSGKSTLLDILYGSRAPGSGLVSIDGHDLRDLSLVELRNQVVVVRDAEIFEGSVLDNLRLGRRWITVAEVRSALAAVGLLDDVMALPDGLQSRLSTDGRPLSSGQVASLMIARAIVGRPRLLLLDEALVALDGDARTTVLDTLFNEAAQWTLLAVTRASDVLARCNRSIALEGREREVA